MTHVNFNDDVRSLADLKCRHHSTPGHVPISDIPSEVLTSPLFVWEELPNDHLLPPMSPVALLEGVVTNPDYLPFRMLRIYIKQNSEADSQVAGAVAIKMWVWHEEGCLHGRLAGVGFNKGVLVAFSTSKKAEMSVVLRNPKGVWCSYQELSPDMRSRVVHFAGYAISSFLCFVREAHSVSNFISSVSPDKKGKSVEWVKARTHYVILHKAHPANSKEVSAGSAVSRNTESIKRQAHTRRAHARVLRSPRFRNKLGLTIHVKATWVGPSEWKENGSIYRMVPRNQSSH